MKNTTLILLTTPALALLLAACGSAAGDTDDTAAAAGAPATSSLEAGPVLPALPHAGWPEVPRERSPLDTTCGTPPANLTDVRADDVASAQEVGGVGSFESVGTYADAATAAEDVEDWRRRITACDGTVDSQSPGGFAMIWYVSPAAVEGADEAWLAFGNSTDEFAEDRPYAVAVRVGRSVFVTGADHPGLLLDPKVARATDALVDEASAYVPELEGFRDAGPVPAVPVSGPDARIPGDVRLPHDGESIYRGPTVAFPDYCLDPPDDLRYADPVDTVGLRDAGDTVTYEVLALYADGPTAGGVIGDWREQIATCAGEGAVDHVGNDYRVEVDPVDVTGADEAWAARDDHDGGYPPRFDLVVRVGSAIYHEVYTPEGVERFSDDEVADLTADGVARMSDYTPSLERFR